MAGFLGSTNPLLAERNGKPSRPKGFPFPSLLDRSAPRDRPAPADLCDSEAGHECQQSEREQPQAPAELRAGASVGCCSARAREPGCVRESTPHVLTEGAPGSRTCGPAVASSTGRAGPTGRSGGSAVGTSDRAGEDSAPRARGRDHARAGVDGGRTIGGTAACAAGRLPGVTRPPLRRGKRPCPWYLWLGKPPGARGCYPRSARFGLPRTGLRRRGGRGPAGRGPYGEGRPRR